MLLRGSNSRGARGQSPIRSRGSARGRGSSRGASTSSGKSKPKENSNVATGPRVVQEAPAGYQPSNRRGRIPKFSFKNHYSSFNPSGTSPTENSPNNFEAERLENAAKREQSKDPTNNVMVTGRGGRGRGNPRTAINHKQVRFASPLAGDTKEETSSKSLSLVPSNPFTSVTSSSSFGTPTATSTNPFATARTETSKNPFGTTASSPNPFGALSQTSQPATTANVFGKPSGPAAAAPAQEALHKPNVFGAPTNPFATTSQTNDFSKSTFPPKSSSGTAPANPFGPPSVTQPSSFSTTPVGSPAFGLSSPGHSSIATTSKPSSDPFGVPPGAKPSAPSTASSPPTFAFGSPASSNSATSQPSSILNGSPFGAPSSGQLQSLPANFGTAAKGSPNIAGTTSQSTSFGTNPYTTASISTPKSATQPKPTALNYPPSSTSNALATTMDQLLRKQGIVPPTWPTSTPGDPRQKNTVESFWQTSKGYRAKVRAALIRAGFLDDPDKPKKLSEAIDFKGTCEDMCPEFEKVTRIVERDVQAAEKELAPDGTMWPAPHKMVKALARSAAGQDAPLPMDVRSPAALRRTFDYLLHTVLGEDGDLSAVHGFLWDRTRAIRRDFVFQSSMSPAELSDQVYCLERITRFHAIALHQMSREEVVAEDFSEQQEIEQLGKALLSLIHAYEDCQGQGITCDNEAEFRAYYVLFNSHNSGILETVQDWGWKFWGESDQVRTAVSLVETLQNIWDMRGPLKPHSATDVAQNWYSRFFSIIEDRKVSYTLACFAEIHFNGVRKSALKTILASYRKQRDQTKDWTLTKLNQYLRFDNEEDIIDFGEAYGLQFQESEGETYLSFDSEEPSDPFPPLKQRHSYSLVERKRGNHSLTSVIDATVYDEGEEASNEPSDEESLFVKDIGAKAKVDNGPIFPSPTADESPPESFASTLFQNQSTSSAERPTSVLNQNAGPQTLGHSFFAPKPAEHSPPAQSMTPQDSSSIYSKLPAQEMPSIFTSTTQPQTKATPPFSFLNQPSAHASGGGTISPLSLGQNTVTANHMPNESPKPVLQPTLSATHPAATLKPLFSLETPSVTADPPTQSSELHSSLEGYSVSPPQRSTVVDTQKLFVPSFNPVQQSPLPQPNSGTGSIFSPALKGTFSDPPQVPISQSKSSSNPLFSNKSADVTGSFAPTKTPMADNRNAQLDNLANWITVGEGGIIDQFTEYHVERILRDTFNIYLKETADRKAKEEEDQARKTADQFRYRSLATKYGHKWRETAHRMWMRRKGRAARKARQEMAESLRASKVLQSANVVEDFRASTSSSRRGSLESLLDATGVLDGVHDPNTEIRAIVQREQLEATSKKRRSGRSTESLASSINNHRRGKSDKPFRRSLLSDPTYLHGGSRIHLMSKYDVKDETRRQVSGVQTDYFRLKARGISTLPNGTPLANSAAKDVLHQKRSFDGIIKPATPKKSLMPPPTPRSVPAQPVTQREGAWKGADSSEVIQAMKARARALMHEDKGPRHKKRTLDDEHELFARAKRVREQMDEGMQWFSKQIESETASRSVS